MILRSNRELTSSASVKQPSPSPLPSLSRSPIQKPPRLRKAKLTHKNLKIFEKEMAKTRKTPGGDSGSGTATSSSKSKNTTTTDKKFGERLYENGVRFEDLDAQPPKDMEEIKQYLDKDRDSQPANEDDYQMYLAATRFAQNEDSVVTNVWPRLAKDPLNQKQFGYNQNTNFAWTEVENVVTANVSDPKPDIFESFQHSQYPPEAVEALGPALAPTTYGVAMPRLCIELKGPGGMMPCATKQAAYDGAVMVDAAWEAHQYMAKPADNFIGKTQALTGAVNNTNLHIYANHAISPRADATKPYPEKLQYHQFAVKELIPKASLEDYNKARKIVRNAQDWAREKATRNKDDLHAHVSAMNAAAAAKAAALATASALTPPRSPAGNVNKRQKVQDKKDDQASTSGV
jgi:hypothetical protein